jgi:hypothetical protein
MKTKFYLIPILLSGLFLLSSFEIPEPQQDAVSVQSSSSESHSFELGYQNCGFPQLMFFDLYIKPGTRSTWESEISVFYEGGNWPYQQQQIRQLDLPEGHYTLMIRSSFDDYPFWFEFDVPQVGVIWIECDGRNNYRVVAP